ncbi:hypothetical protein D9M73_201920 [compost metagenome]
MGIRVQALGRGDGQATAGADRLAAHTQPVPLAEDLPAVERAVCSKAQRVDETGHGRQGELIDEHEGNPQVGLEVLGRGIVRGFEMALGFHGTAQAMQDENDPTPSLCTSTSPTFYRHCAEVSAGRVLHC